jgi:hypothetical protein
MNGLLAALMKPTRRKVFVSYHHGGDQTYYEQFSHFFHNECEAIRDNSLERLIQSDDTEYVMRQIREQYITGTSCTIVLIGAQSHERNYLDWEIKATLDKCHGLIGIVLPTHQESSRLPNTNFLNALPNGVHRLPVVRFLAVLNTVELIASIPSCRKGKRAKVY